MNISTLTQLKIDPINNRILKQKLKNQFSILNSQFSMITLRPLTISDLEKYHHWQLPSHEYHALNGPYFTKKSEAEIQDFIHELKSNFENGTENPLPQKRLIADAANQIIGEVSWSWRSKETLWKEIGIVIFDKNYWSKGIGYQALQMWITELFETHQAIVRLGLTTWSGNIGMIKLAEKLNMKQEAVYRKARIVRGEYYDSVSYGILREEWEGGTKI